MRVYRQTAFVETSCQEAGHGWVYKRTSQNPLEVARVVHTQFLAQVKEITMCHAIDFEKIYSKHTAFGIDIDFAKIKLH